MPYRSYLVAVLMATLAFNFADRMALGLLLQDIKVEFKLSDLQLGLLSGIAFTLFYSVMGLPIARWADSGNRVRIISLTIGIWGAAMALCAFATNFVQLLLIRVGVAVGEAGCMPPAQSLIADHFDRSERPRALARFHLGIPLSVVLGYFLAGWINEFYGWRSAFVALGIPGLPLAILAWFTLREPRQSAPAQIPADRQDPGQPGFMTVCATLWSSRTFRHLMVCWSIASFFGYGITQWKPAFFIRSFGLQTGEAGTWFAIIYGIGGLLGTLLGGSLASRYAPNDERLQLRAMALAYCCFGIISAAIYLSPSLYLSLLLMGISLVGFYLTYGPFFALVQTLVPPRMRAMSITIIYLLANLVGMGIGPLAAGALSDVLRPLLGEESLRYSLLAFCPGYVWAGWHLWQASATVSEDLRQVGLEVGAAAPA